MNPLGWLFAPLADIGKTWLEGHQKAAARRDRLEEAKTKAEEARLTKYLEDEGSYDIEAQRQMQFSWKDEYLTILMSLPFIASFIPGVQDYAARGWEYVAMAPAWYTWSFIGIIVATFGLRGFRRGITPR